MRLDRLDPRPRRVIVCIATVSALGAIGLRAFVFDYHGVWNLALLALQGVAMIIVMVIWGTFRQPPHERGVDMDAKRLHW